MDNDSFAREEDAQLHHVLLPRVLPQGKDDLDEIGFILLNKMVENVEKLSQYLPQKTVELFRRMQNIHAERTPENIAKNINALQPGDSFAMFVRLQHCTIMIYIPLDEEPDNIQNAIVSTFSDLHPNEVYKYESDIEVSFLWSLFILFWWY